MVMTPDSRHFTRSPAHGRLDRNPTTLAINKRNAHSPIHAPHSTQPQHVHLPRRPLQGQRRRRLVQDRGACVPLPPPLPLTSDLKSIRDHALSDKEPGCKGYNPTRGKDDPLDWLVYEEYADQAAVDGESADRVADNSTHGQPRVPGVRGRRSQSHPWRRWGH